MNFTFVVSLISGSLGLLIGWLIAACRHQNSSAKIFNQLTKAITSAEEKIQYLEPLSNTCERLQKALETERVAQHHLEVKLREAHVRLEEIRLAAQEKQQVLEKNEQRICIQFENLARRIFEDNGRRLDENNRQNLGNILNPLREQLEGFRRQVQESVGNEARERHTLTHEIRRLQELNIQMAQETTNLTRALKGNNKIQGNWGELILSRVLEASGLRKGHEYETQVACNTIEKGRLQPDAIVRLPQEKSVIIDAKMTLLAYENYVNTQDEAIREQALNQHLSAIRAHIRTLSSKDYHQLPSIHSLDYVLMFIPIESALSLAIEKQPSLLIEAQKLNIMLVSPTTLLIALRTISNLWQYEHQSKNAQDIAQRAARLYDKMRLFVEDMRRLGQRLQGAQDSYQQAMNKLSQGQGNLIKQCERFRELGVSITKPIDTEIALRAHDHKEENEIEKDPQIMPISSNTFITSLTPNEQKAYT